MAGQGVRVDLAGQRFGKLVVIDYAGQNHAKRALWRCNCDCGSTKAISGKNLRRGLTRSCGCLKKAHIGLINASHGMTNTPTYGTYSSMLSRCYNKNQGAYKKYGALGVKVCDRWRESFENFFEDMGERPAGMTLDRINPFGHYEKSNCKWSTAGEQSINRRGDVAIRLITQLLDGEITLDDVKKIVMASDEQAGQ